ncbi:vegetative cell wall protein gp1-like [Iris pallida]|uniref:Vegetative cell wall protein gp1-like n=1 Tax=Iris pallida TaxID=29817 RepID=A0AAX6DQ16_IRIPA|nr:vegetative cell wall protein gp1-like [Iris pallida]
MGGEVAATRGGRRWRDSTEGTTSSKASRSPRSGATNRGGRPWLGHSAVSTDGGRGNEGGRRHGGGDSTWRVEVRVVVTLVVQRLGAASRQRVATPLVGGRSRGKGVDLFGRLIWG